MKMLTLASPTKVEELLLEAEKEDVVLMRGGHPIALISALDDDGYAWYLRENDPAFIASVADSRAQIASGDVISHEALKREFSE